MNELLIILALNYLVWVFFLYISVGKSVDWRDILLAGLLSPSLTLLKIVGYVLSFVGINVYYQLVFDRLSDDSGVE